MVRSWTKGSSTFQRDDHEHMNNLTGPRSSANGIQKLVIGRNVLKG